jgi:hypothetical protein
MSCLTKINIEASVENNMIINSSEFNPARDIAYSKPRVNKAGGKGVGIINKSIGRQLYINLPLMITWGVNRRVDDATGRVSYDMSIQFPTEEYATDETRKSLAAFIEMEEQVKADAIVHSKEWFNKSKLTIEQVEVLFNPMLYWPKNPETGERREGAAPTLRVKLDCWENKFNCEIYDINENTLYSNADDHINSPEYDSSITPVELIQKGCKVGSIIKCGGIYFVNGKFGITWRLSQSIVKQKLSISGRCYVKLSNSEVAQLSSEQEKEPKQEHENAEVVESEDEKEEEHTEPTSTVEEEPVTKQKKRVVRRKD